MSKPGTSQKRQRTDEDAPEAHSSVVLRRSSRLYFPDGNIVIRTSIPANAPADIYQTPSPDKNIENLSFALLYRVHTGVLASQCGFFSSLFGGSQEAFGHASEKYDDVPVMDLPGDDWQAVDDFLKSIYLPNHMTHSGTPPSERDGDEYIAFLGRVLTLAKKYEAQDIRALAVRIIETFWPSQLWLWEKDRNYRALHFDPARALNIANAHSVHSILPVAFLELHLMLKPDFLVFMKHVNDDVSHPSPDLNLLSADYLRRVIKGGAAFDTACKILFRHLETMDMSPSCNQNEEGDVHRCQSTRTEFFDKSKQLGTPTFELRTAHPLFFLRGIEREGEALRGLCRACREIVKSRVKIEKSALWWNLPKIFELVDVVGDNWGLKGL